MYRLSLVLQEYTSTSSLRSDFFFKTPASQVFSGVCLAYNIGETAVLRVDRGQRVFLTFYPHIHPSIT